MSGGQRRSVILGTGSELPSKVITNADLEKNVETSDEWITTRTGIKERRILEKPSLHLYTAHANINSIHVI